MRFILSLALLFACSMPVLAQYGIVRQRAVFAPQFAAGCDVGCVQAQAVYGVQAAAIVQPVYAQQVFAAQADAQPVFAQRQFIQRQFVPAYGLGVGRQFGVGRAGLFSAGGLGGGGLNLNIGNGSINNGNAGSFLPGAGLFRGRFR